MVIDCSYESCPHMPHVLIISCCGYARVAGIHTAHGTPQRLVTTDAPSFNQEMGDDSVLQSTATGGAGSDVSVTGLGAWCPVSSGQTFVMVVVVASVIHTILFIHFAILYITSLATYQGQQRLQTSSNLPFHLLSLHPYLYVRLSVYTHLQDSSPPCQPT